VVLGLYTEAAIPATCAAHAPSLTCAPAPAAKLVLVALLRCENTAQLGAFTGHVPTPGRVTDTFEVACSRARPALTYTLTTGTGRYNMPYAAVPLILTSALVGTPASENDLPGCPKSMYSISAPMSEIALTPPMSL